MNRSIRPLLVCVLALAALVNGHPVPDQSLDLRDEATAVSVS